MQKDKSLFNELNNIVATGTDEELKKYLLLRPITATAFKRICKARGWKTYNFQGIPCADISGTYEKFYYVEVDE